MNRNITRAIAVLSAVALAGLAAFLASRPAEAPAAAAVDEVPAALLERVRIVLITEFSAGAHATQYLEGVRSEAAALGLTLDVLDARNDRQKMAELLENAVLSQA